MRDASQFRFRAWHKAAKKMAVIDALLWSTDGYLAHTADGLSGSGHLSDIVLMQWTGLVDRTGREIYEGDIVTWEAMGTLYTADVAWIPEQAMFLPNDMNDDVEVIGNVWEPPALLDGEDSNDTD